MVLCAGVFAIAWMGRMAPEAVAPVAGMPTLPWTRVALPILLLAGLAAVIMLRLSGPVARLAGFVSGGLDAGHGLLQRRDDIGSLAREFHALLRDLREREENLNRERKIDPVTGVANRTVVPDRVAMAIARSARNRTGFALLVVDICCLAAVNDRHGHQVGDQLLSIVAKRLGEGVRATDSVCRLGSTEFLVILEEGSAENLLRVAGELAGSLADPARIEQASIPIVSAAGVAHHPAHGDTPEALLRRADIARRHARGSSVPLAVYENGQEESHLREIALLNDLATAIVHDQLFMHYQPKMSLSSGSVGQVEALVRWDHPQLGRVPPDEFIPIAERSGQVRHLTRWVIEAVMRQQSDWRDAGLEVPVAINLSTVDLADPDFPRTLGILAKVHSAVPSQLLFEITESSIMSDLAVTSAVIDAVREAGYQIAIDDFGTGYSSLAQLKRLPVRELKIDKSFVSRLQEGTDDAVIVRSTIEMAHNMGLVVVAEGVEDEAVIELLARWNCDMIQGYHLSRPMDSASLATWLKERMPGTQGVA